MEASSFLRLEANDNVLVALKDLKKGTNINIDGNSVTLAEDIPAKHKLFLQDMHPGSEIIMYGVLVGKTQSDVPKGGLMSTGNTKHAADPFDYRGYKYSWRPPDVSKFKNRTFNGYHRKDGRVGTANYWLFIPTVFCENRNLDVLKEVLHNELGYSDTEKYKQFTRSLVKAYSEGQNLDQFDTGQLSPQQKHHRLFENVDGIKFLNHEGGCGGTRQDSAILSSLLVSYADHPNVAGVTLLSLGCQHLQIPDFRNDIQKRNPSFDKPLLIFEQQAMESEETLVKKAIVQTFKHLVEINKLRLINTGKNNEMNILYQEIGKMFVTASEQNESMDASQYQSLVEKIQILKHEIEQNKMKINNLSDQKECAQCAKPNAIDSKYCMKCGHPFKIYEASDQQLQYIDYKEDDEGKNS